MRQQCGIVNELSRESVTEKIDRLDFPDRIVGPFPALLSLAPEAADAVVSAASAGWWDRALSGTSSMDRLLSEAFPEVSYVYPKLSQALSLTKEAFDATVSEARRRWWEGALSLFSSVSAFLRREFPGFPGPALPLPALVRSKRDWCLLFDAWVLRPTYRGFDVVFLSRGVHRVLGGPRRLRRHEPPAPGRGHKRSFRRRLSPPFPEGRA